MAVTILRWVATAILLIGTYKETGVFTALCLTLCVVAIELINKTINLQIKCMKMLKDLTGSQEK